jgi:hypothetical protein
MSPWVLLPFVAGSSAQGKKLPTRLSQGNGSLGTNRSKINRLSPSKSSREIKKNVGGWAPDAGVGPWRLGFSLTGGEGVRAMGPKNRGKQVKVSFEVNKGEEREL